jgi:uncharacterized protein YecT (DUF1311 family)
MTNNERIIERIIGVRSRRRFGYAISELFVRLNHLERAFQDRVGQDRELLKYYPVGLVACIEAFFRLAVTELVDSGEPFMNRARSLAARHKFDFEVVKALHGKRVTIGELIAHGMSANRLDDISAQMSELLGVDFLKSLASVYDRWSVEIEGAPKKPMIKDPDFVYAGVARTFELRHIFCHEFATTQDLELVEIDKCFNSTMAFLKASVELISETVHPGAPLTQTDMNRVSYEEFQAEQQRLREINNALLEKLDANRKKQYEIVNKAWEEFLRLSVEFSGMEFPGGSIRPTIENSEAAEMTRRRIEEVKALVKFASEI